MRGAAGVTIHVDFHILAQEKQRDRYACRLIEQAYLDGKSLFVRTADAQHTRSLDDLLWTFRGGSFLPHEIYDPTRAPQSPVLLGESGLPNASFSTLVNLTDALPETRDSILNILEIVDGDADSKAKARERYREYRERGYSLQTKHVDTAESNTRE
jgi:DNA polymerase-3 subunit chi